MHNTVELNTCESYKCNAAQGQVSFVQCGGLICCWINGSSFTLMLIQCALRSCCNRLTSGFIFCYFLQTSMLTGTNFIKKAKTRALIIFCYLSDEKNVVVRLNTLTCKWPAKQMARVSSSTQTNTPKDIPNICRLRGDKNQNSKIPPFYIIENSLIVCLFFPLCTAF